MIIKALFYILFLIVYGQAKMDIGPTIAIFLIVATVLMLSFCLLLKYYANRLDRERRGEVNIDALEDSLYRSSESIIEGAYQEFRERREQQRCTQMKEMVLPQDQIIQNSELRQVLDISNNIYGLSKLRQNLNNQVPPLTQETMRSFPSMKSFNISRLNTTESEKERVYHPFLEKLVAYTDKGLFVVQVEPKSIMKRMGAYQIIRNPNEIIQQQPGEDDFCDQLEAYGFYPLGYGYQKYTRSVDVTDLKEGETVMMKGLKGHTERETVSRQEYERLRVELGQAEEREKAEGEGK